MSGQGDFDEKTIIFFLFLAGLALPVVSKDAMLIDVSINVFPILHYADVKSLTLAPLLPSIKGFIRRSINLWYMSVRPANTNVGDWFGGFMIHWSGSESTYRLI